MTQLPWSRPTGVEAVVAKWQTSGALQSCIVGAHHLAAQEPQYVPLPADLPELLKGALRARKIFQLYSHQAEATAAALAGQHVVVATPTASGKSLCFHLPVLSALIQDPSATALYVYPTKALSRDQEHNLLEMMQQAGISTSAMVFDGDTPGDARRVVRERCRIVLTNPDMLHAGILPAHVRWATLFQGLRYVVLDELHTYRGVFGSHMAHVLGRLRRIAAFHGSQPQFIAATATIGNPREHASRLIGVPADQVALVEQSGAPRASRNVYVYNPPLVNAELGIRASPLKQAVNLAADLVTARVPTLVFGSTRNAVEVMLKYLRERVGQVAGAEAIMAYRGGYLPETRRQVEAGLRNGRILCVVATHALELGIDIGDLGAVICVGFPGTIAGLWQRFGRAGRRGSKSLAVLVCGSDPLDQYLATEPGYILKSGVEEARIDPGNVEILIQHLKCAAFEAPFQLASAGERPAHPLPARGESFLTLDADTTRDALEYLSGHGLVHASAGRYYWCGEGFPASSVSLRNVGWDNFVIVDLAQEQAIAELDFRAAHSMLHEQAIYQHNAEQYQVERLDYENHKAYVRKVESDYFTTALSYRTVAVIETRAQESLGPVRLGHGDVKVIEKVTGYKKLKFFTHENAGYGEVFLPEMQLHTSSFWLTLPEGLLSEFKEPRKNLIEGLRGVGHALEIVCALALMCDRRDIGQTLGDGSKPGVESGAPVRDPHQGQTGGFDPTIFLFDAVAGGVGFAPRIFELASQLLTLTKRRIESCTCHTGCPACVGPGEAPGIRRRLALALISRCSVDGGRDPK